MPFQSTLPRRERHLSQYDSEIDKSFQSTLPRRERRNTGVRHTPPSRFQSTLPRRERHGSFGWSSINKTNFNPHSHEGSDDMEQIIQETDYQFQSTLPRRERQSLIQVIPSCQRFQSTLPRRERRLRLINLSQGKRISIHTPTKGATAERGARRYMGRNFNPHSHEGSDGIATTGKNIAYVFQSTLPRRERLQY